MKQTEVIKLGFVPKFQRKTPSLWQAVCYGLASGALVASTIAQADENVTSTPQVELESISVTGTRMTYDGDQALKFSSLGLLGHKDIKDTPFNVINYTDKYVNYNHAKDVTDVINATDPSVFTDGDKGAWSEHFYIRGFEVEPGDSTVNGLIGISPLYRTSPEMYEKIQVLKGPSAILSGMPPKGSIGGSIEMTPKRAKSQPTTQIALDYQSDAHVGVRTDLGRRFGEDQAFGARFNGVYRNGDTAVDGQKRKTALTALALDMKKDNFDVVFDAYWNKNHIDGVARGLSLRGGIDHLPKPPKTTTGLTPDWSYVDTTDKGWMLSGNLDLSDRILAFAKYGQSRTDYFYNGAAGGQILNQQGDFKTPIGQLQFDIEKKSGEVGLRGLFNMGPISHQWAINATKYEHDQHEYGLVPRPNWPADKLAQWHRTTNMYHPSWGEALPRADVLPQFLDRKLELTGFGIADTLSFDQDKWQLTFGLRHQNVKDESGIGNKTVYDKSATVPSVAAVYKYNDKLSFYANYMQGLTQGASAPATAVNAGEVLAPFKTKQTEAGVKFDAFGLSNTVSVFDIKKPSSYTDPDTKVFAAAGEQRNRGIEWSFVGSVHDNMRLMGGASFLKPEMTKTMGGVNQGKQAVGVPKQQFKLGAELDIPALSGLTLTANASYASKLYLDKANTVATPSRTIYDIGARYNTKIGGQLVTFDGKIHNLTNQAYWGVGWMDSFLMLGSPRTVMLSATMDF
ncbi:TonB-dependent receptor [Moraxella marmotae]|uniref:TonB-dependent receptor n=1 Tax=Moraxella marmotae TaxID=3344520 RepID=UPI0035F48EC8